MIPRKLLSQDLEMVFGHFAAIYHYILGRLGYLEMKSAVEFEANPAAMKSCYIRRLRFGIL